MSRPTPSLSPNTAPSSWSAAAGPRAPEGTPRSRNVVIVFKDYQTAVECYHSPEYAAAKALRETAAEADLLIIEGYEGSQPG